MSEDILEITSPKSSIGAIVSFTWVSLAACVKDALLRNRKPILDLTLDWRCLMWVWNESLQVEEHAFSFTCI